MHKLLLIIATMLVPVGNSFAANTVDFDSGVDLKNFSEEKLYETSNIEVKGPTGWEYENRRWWDEDCVNFTTDKSGPVSYEPYNLESELKVEYCRDVFVPDGPPPGGNQHPGGGPGPHNGGFNPGPGGHHPGGPGGPGGHHGPRAYDYETSDVNRGYRRECHVRVVDSVRKAVQLSIKDRKLFPWESEQFSACLEERNVKLYEKKVAYDYKAAVTQDDSTIKRYEMTPVKRLPTPPDPDGLSVRSLEYVNGAFHFTFADKWAEYYPNEKTVLKVTLIRNRTLWFDKKVVTKTFTLPTNAEYTVDFEQKEGVKNGTYHINWSFVREGQTSTQDEIDMGRSDKQDDFEVRDGKVMFVAR